MMNKYRNSKKRSQNPKRKRKVHQVTPID